jgi:hypothetical protein
MPTFSELKQQADSTANVRKALEGFAYMAPMTATVPDSIIAADGSLLALPTDYWPVGIVTKDGWVFTSSMDKDEIEAWGYSNPVRIDITKAPKSVKFTSLEADKRHLLELALGVDLSSAQESASGEVVFEEPDVPQGGEYRLFVLHRDFRNGQPYYRAKAIPRVKLADVGDEKWETEGGRSQEYTLDVLVDEELGFPIRHYIAGAAFDAVNQGFLAHA